MKKILIIAGILTVLIYLVKEFMKEEITYDPIKAKDDLIDSYVKNGTSTGNVFVGNNTNAGEVIDGSEPVLGMVVERGNGIPANEGSPANGFDYSKSNF